MFLVKILLRSFILFVSNSISGSPNHSDPDEIMLASEASIRSLVVSPVPTVSDAGFQTNMTIAAVASSNTNNGTTGIIGQKYPLRKKNTNNFFKQINHKSDIGVQTDKDITEESGGFKAEATTTKKIEIIGKQ